jgi:hypothetical protein
MAVTDDHDIKLLREHAQQQITHRPAYQAGLGIPFQDIEQSRAAGHPAQAIRYLADVMHAAIVARSAA